MPLASVSQVTSDTLYIPTVVIAVMVGGCFVVLVMVVVMMVVVVVVMVAIISPHSYSRLDGSSSSGQLIAS